MKKKEFIKEAGKTIIILALGVGMIYFGCLFS